MSGDEELDKLLFSIPKSSKKKKQADSKENLPVDETEQPAKKSAEADQESGFDPVDVVELSDEQRKIATWLSRHPRSSFEDIQEALAIAPEELQGLLAKLQEEKRIRSVERGDKLLYSAPIHGRANRRLRGFPQDLWKKAGLDED